MKENEAKLTKLKELFARLPPSVPEGGRRDAIHQVLNNLHTANGWESFNSKFDTLFGTSTINEDGTLKNLTRGPKGAGLVMRALEHYLSQDGMPEIAWLKVDRLIDGCEAMIRLAQGESPGGSSAGLPAVTETEVEATAQVQKVQKTVKRKEPAPKRPTIVTALGSTNYLAIHDAQDLDIPLSPGKKKAAKNYKPREGDSESDSEQDAEVRLAPDGREILDSDDGDDASDYSNTKLSYKRKRSIDSASGSDSAAFSAHSDAEDIATEAAESTGNDSVVEIDKEQGISGSKKGRPTKKQRKEASRRNLKAKQPRKSSKQSKAKKTPTSEPIDVDSIPDTDSDTPATLPGKRGPKNKSLHHYYNPVPIKDKSKELRWSFTCRYCKTVRTVARTEGVDDFDLERNVAGLANLASHISQKHGSRLTKTTPAEGPEETATAEAGVTKASQAILKSFVERGKLNPRLEPTQNGFNRMVSVWILEDGLPFTASESPGLARIFKYVKIPYKLPSDTTVWAVLKDVYKELSNAVTSEVKKVSSKISFSSDAWTTKQMTFSFSGLFGHWITNDWNMKMRLLSFTALQPDDHKGFYGAISFAKIAAKRGALRKILAHTMDGASSNDVQAQTTSTILQKKYSIHWAPSNGRIFCMAHGGHRTVQKFLQILDEADDPDIDDYFIHHRSQPIHFDAEEDSSVVEHEAETTLASLDEEPETVEEWQEEALIFSADSLSPIKKLHLTCIKIVSTPGRRSIFRSLAAKHCPKYKHLMPVRSVVTRWNSVLASIERGILLRPAITHWVRRHPDLEHLELSNTDWSFLEQIVTVLSLFSGMTLQMSRSDTPTLPWVLPLYQHISKSLLSLAKPDEVLEYPIPKPGQPSRKALSPKVRNAVLGALVVWEKYRGYALTSHFPILATLCHPMFRIRWFENSASELEAKARLLFETIFDSYQSDALTKEPAAQSSTSLSRSSSRSSLSSSFLDDVLGPLEDDGASVEALAESETVRYFRGDGGLSEDPLEWWKTHAEKFPIISQMARDFLAIPGSSVSVERLFSSARHLCADARSSLQAETITEAMCSKQWMKEGIEGFTLVKPKVN